MELLNYRKFAMTIQHDDSDLLNEIFSNGHETTPKTLIKDISIRAKIVRALESYNDQKDISIWWRINERGRAESGVRDQWGFIKWQEIYPLSSFLLALKYPKPESIVAESVDKHCDDLPF